MTMMFEFARSTCVSMITATPSKRMEQDCISAQIAAFHAKGGNIEILQTREYDQIRPQCKYIETDETKPTLTREQAAKWLKITDAMFVKLVRDGFAPKSYPGAQPRERRYAIIDLREWREANKANPFHHPTAAVMAGMVSTATATSLLGLDRHKDTDRKVVIGAAVMGSLKIGMQFDAPHGKKIRFFWPVDVDAYRRMRR